MRWPPDEEVQDAWYYDFPYCAPMTDYAQSGAEVPSPMDATAQPAHIYHVQPLSTYLPSSDLNQRTTQYYASVHTSESQRANAPIAGLVGQIAGLTQPMIPFVQQQSWDQLVLHESTDSNINSGKEQNPEVEPQRDKPV